MWNNDTRKLSCDDYDDLLANIFRYFSDCPGVVRYGTFGSVAAPGLSDLDVLVVVEDIYIKNKIFKLPMVREADRYMLMHPPLVVPLSMVDSLDYYHLIKIKWSDGSLQEPQNSEDTRIISLINIFWKTIYLQRFISELCIQNVKSTRRAILAFTSVARSIEFSNEHGIKISEKELSYVESLHRLRKNWFRGSEKQFENKIEILETLLRESLEVCLKLPTRIARDLLELTETTSMKSIHTTGLQFFPGRFIIGIDESDLNEALDRSLSLNSRYNSKFRRIIRQLLYGSVCFVGPESYCLLENDYTRLRRSAIIPTCWAWGRKDRKYPIYKVPRNVVKTLDVRFNVNRAFADLLVTGGLEDANFGTIWKPKWLMRVAWSMVAIVNQVFVFYRWYRFKKSE